MAQAPTGRQPQWSADHTLWWDGSAWRRVSPDGEYFWDGSQWRPVPAAPDQRWFWDGSAWRQGSPDGNYFWDGSRWQPVPAPSRTENGRTLLIGAGLIGGLLLLGLLAVLGWGVALLGMILAIVVFFSARVRQWSLWKRVPGLRESPRRGAFAAIVAVYLIPVPALVWVSAALISGGGTSATPPPVAATSPTPTPTVDDSQQLGVISPRPTQDTTSRAAGPTPTDEVSQRPRLVSPGPSQDATPNSALTAPERPTPTAATAAPGLAPTPASTTSSPNPSNPSLTGATSAQGISCSPNPMAHVYSPDRLRILVPCVTVNGVIELRRAEPDGDFHVRLKLDPGQGCGGQPCLTQGNATEQAGDLVLEPVCEHPVTQADAIAVCASYKNPLIVPPIGTHIAATGPFVFDLDHNWNEIHPLESITVLPPVGPSSPSPTQSPSPPATATAAPAPRSTAPVPATVSVSITASRYGYVAAQTLPGATCSAQAKLPSGRTSTANGLQPTKPAGGDGTVSWSYGTTSSTTPGTGTHTVTCTVKGQTASASAPFTV